SRGAARLRAPSRPATRAPPRDEHLANRQVSRRTRCLARYEVSDTSRRDTSRRLATGHLATGAREATPGDERRFQIRRSSRTTRCQTTGGHHEVSGTSTAAPRLLGEASDRVRCFPLQLSARSSPTRERKRGRSLLADHGRPETALQETAPAPPRPTTPT